MEDLIRRCRNKDKEAMEHLYEKYKNQVYRTAFIITRSRMLAEDITQESFIRVFSKIDLYNEEYSFDSWLYKVVLNVSRNTIRKQKWENLLKPFKDAVEKPDMKTPSLELEQKEREEMLKEIIDGLSYKLKEVIVLKYYNCFSQEDIANILQIPIGTVKSRINSGLSKIRIRIERHKQVKEVLNYE